jgi:hypothetical protein
LKTVDEKVVEEVMAIDVDPVFDAFEPATELNPREVDDDQPPQLAVM